MFKTSHINDVKLHVAMCVSTLLLFRKVILMGPCWICSLAPFGPVDEEENNNFKYSQLGKIAAYICTSYLKMNRHEPDSTSKKLHINPYPAFTS